MAELVGPLARSVNPCPRQRVLHYGTDAALPPEPSCWRSRSEKHAPTADCRPPVL